MGKAQREAGGFSIRPAGPADVGLVLRFIRELAAYEKLEDQVVADEATLSQQMFQKGRARAVIAEYEGEPVGFALYFFNFSTFLGRGGLYLEDLYLTPAVRGKGFGQRMFCYLAQVALQEGCGRMEWWCLDWNTPSQGFYRRMGAQPMEDWTVWRMTRQALEALAEEGTV
ncbi:MAG TPA: GNAT family N-acetyltransferase [Candidatus Anaerotruncus excrementipullorum]|uniref:GNAT family N-acetyltransferase n=1 Tax=Candidatus Anaerotruncus excrementipullorum TaxID=2838465 RepID=A0A9D1WQL7_9FIRM|nr:GNAT family N-acetyltransferase [Candidatus Anaerotruncus excrementipullorum]